ncbi:hypothetical protein DE146DRAFT_618893 [Phaeosphaeria sp. MPI-PUGE-AT-0046c]|nr:hypothetical protein DE146DRAFT_618893 [Phaeosphaeria sp. MPI-PUGE-AT-0046c]
MVYNWDDKEGECYRLYVEEKHSLDEVISFWEVRGFTPSKQNPAHKNPALVTRLTQLWEQNYTQKDMIDTLQNEGFPINDRELIRLRLRLKLLLRESVPRPRRKRATDGDSQQSAKKNASQAISHRGLINQLGNAILADESQSADSDNAADLHEGEAERHASSTTPVNAVAPELHIGDESAPLSTEEALRKQLRQEQLQLESDEKWRTRKRRRRTRGWAGLPADAPGEPPRFPSETTIDEAKAYLELDNEMYRNVRERFSQICKEQEVIKKTVVGPEKWAETIRQLISESEHLSVIFEQEPDVFSSVDALFRPKGQRALSIDVICMDVTKRLRTMDSRMTLADAKNILCLNPEQTRHIRADFAAKLKADHFTNKHEAGEQHWADLKTAWVNESELLARALAAGEADPEYARKLRAIEVLARDVMKRQQQEKTAKDPTRKKQVHQGPGPGPARPVMTQQAPASRSRSLPDGRLDVQSTSQIDYDNMTALASAADLQIDPSLLLAASDAAISPTSPYPTGQTHHQYQYHAPSPQTYRPAGHLQPPSTTYTQHQQHPQPYSPTTPAPSTASPAPPPLPPFSLPIPIYFRLHPHSSTPFPAKSVWLSILQSVSVQEVKQLAMREHPGTSVLRLEGLVQVGEDREVEVEVGDDGELGAYLGHVGRGKVMFVVLVGAGAEGLDG